MSAATAISYRMPVPLYREGLAFWDELLSECEQLAQSINDTAKRHGLTEGHLVEWLPTRGVRMRRKMLPSTDIAASLSFERWGPLIKVSVTGYQHEDLRFYPEENEVPLARDLDGKTVAVFGEGRSFSARELACYLVQHMRRCFPEMSLPCAPQ